MASNLASSWELSRGVRTQLHNTLHKEGEAGGPRADALVRAGAAAGMAPRALAEAHTCPWAGSRPDTRRAGSKAPRLCEQAPSHTEGPNTGLQALGLRQLCRTNEFRQ